MNILINSFYKLEDKELINDIVSDYINHALDYNVDKDLLFIEENNDPVLFETMNELGLKYNKPENETQIDLIINIKGGNGLELPEYICKNKNYFYLISNGINSINVYIKYIEKQFIYPKGFLRNHIVNSSEIVSMKDVENIYKALGVDVNE